ncbi:NAD(P)/FAD-dependent oxidoreductase [Mucilaginibacter sp. KACC 22063]|uniref:NAD(P)/FAD-dependent oxidoreductase n=1 Tax=Mucilaginibacter sp. KACC 22063 TaxID=3025666 RepID=UPI002365E8DE|nr:NAD(P)/FAD-dependent oxidoreductase [Mucilaginibacter sp. KACC 22063]WDF54693.1 NAD(P)/FAD-dependent oxidoreductase [Mucilaginibacter sp. KACC 22063]
MESNHIFDVIIIGGSYAGLSAAMALGRSLRKVLIIDSGNPCNKQTPHSHNFLTQDGSPPYEISAIAKKQVENYPTVSFHNGSAVSGKRSGDYFEISTDNGESFNGKKLLFASGITDIMPNIKGFSECWGITVIHCPYCHGYEFRGQQTAVLANGDRAFHIASLVKNLTDQITIFTSGDVSFTDDQLKRLNDNQINIVTTALIEIAHNKGHLEHLVLADGSKHHFTAAYASLPFRQSSDIPMSLGCELTEQGYLKVDLLQKTTTDGVFACGDNAVMMRSVANAVYSGNMAGAAINKELTDASF